MKKLMKVTEWGQRAPGSRMTREQAFARAFLTLATTQVRYYSRVVSGDVLRGWRELCAESAYNELMRRACV
jgi:hypothetical protein